jgi:CRISPR-associated endonuclease Csn1
MRAMAHERLLSARELAVALGHIARHRGFKSNAKSRGENVAEDSKMKKAMAETQEKMAGRTFGQLMASDPAFAGRKRNREGDYSRTPLRADLEAEVRAIFRAQQRRQNPAATPALEADFIATAFFQRGLQDSEKLLADCAFEPQEKRTSKRAFSFELFRYLSRLNTFTIEAGRNTRRLTQPELERAIAAFGSTKKISFKALRKILKLGDEERFAGVREQDEGNDCVARHGEAAAGTATLKAVLDGAAWDSLVKTPEKLDRIAEVITFREDLGNIRKGLEETGLDPLIIEALMQAVQDGIFTKFAGAGHISSKACRNMIPHLAQGKVYSDAAAACNYDHTQSRERNAFNVGITGKQALKEILSRQIIDRSLVGSPIARKALIEAVKQVKAVAEAYGIPDAVHVELARDVGKGIEERREIERGIEKRNKEKERLRARFAEDVGEPCRTAEDLLRYELWLEQNGRCVYSDVLISPRDIVATSNAVEVDHILPWSRFGDDSFHNKTLCTAKANREKRGQTPYEWFGSNEAQWAAYVARVQSLPALRGIKRRNYTLKDAASAEERFRSRNLNDTRWVCRLLAECLKQLYPKDEGQRRVFTRPGALTDRMRRGWGLQWVKKNEKGERIADDRHHALDAIVCAATTEAMMQKLTKVFQKEEEMGGHRDFRALDQPWPGFREQTLAAVERVFVSRAERRRARGEAHAATIRSVSERDGERLVFERRRIGDLKDSDLDRIKDPERNAATIAALRAWIAAGKPEDAPPLSPKGDPIAKVTLRTNKKPDVSLRGGVVDRGEMARVDVFRKQNKKGAWQYYLVPIYPHQIATMEEPPKCAVQAHQDEARWPALDDTFEFMWSLVPMEYLEIETGKGQLIGGYYRGMDRASGNLEVSQHQDSDQRVRGIGARTLRTLDKYHVDRLGRKLLVRMERRTWRGKVCT